MAWSFPAKIYIPSILFLTLALPSTGFTKPVDTKMQEGISHYHKRQFKGAVEKFSSARVDRPKDSRIAYNLGNAHYRDGKFQEALQAYTQSALDKKNPDIRKKSVYNIGNTMVKLGKLEEAESAYKKVLTLDPSDMDAKHNLEYVRQQLKDKESQKQNSGQDQQKGKDNPSEKDQAKNQQPKNEDGQQEGDQPPPPSETNSENRENSGQPEEATIEAEISKEKAEQILEGLSEDLKNISRMQAGKTKSEYQGNDW